MRKTAIILNIMNIFFQVFSIIFYSIIFVNVWGVDITDAQGVKQLLMENFLFTLFLIFWILLGMMIFGTSIASLICCVKLSHNQKGRTLGITASLLAMMGFIIAYVPFFNFSLQLIIIIIFWVSAVEMIRNKEGVEVE